MLLAIDVGNTNTVVGVFEADASGIGAAARAAGELAGFAHHWRVSTVPERTADELALQLKELLALDGLVLPRRGRVASGSADGVAGYEVSGIAISSTVPVVTGALREMAMRYFDCPLVVIGPGVRTGIPIRFDNPKEVGADRIANAVAAVDLHGGPAIVVDLGTATTFDVVSAADEYIGGIIVPGLGISLEALASRAAALRRVELTLPRSVIGRTTVEAMQSGTLYGQAALVEGLCARIAEEIGTPTVIITGGFGPLVAPQLRGPVALEPWLTLHGLRLLYERNLEFIVAAPTPEDAGA
jgi:type III pantothenate kinase